MSATLTVIDEAGLNQAVTATFETGPHDQRCIRLRPHKPTAYYAAQEYAIVLTFEAMDRLNELAERNGYRRTR